MALTPTITSAGITAPAYADLLAELQDQFRVIYGSDIYIEPDSQDGQWLATLALAMDDANQAAVAVWNSFSPSNSQGVQLSNLVKINGLRRNTASNSQAVVRVTGQIGTTINNGRARDDLSNTWALPAAVTIPAAGYIDVTATCETLGAITAPAGTITQIATPTRGWQSVTNLAAASPGEAVETDAELRARQKVSTALPSKTVTAGMLGALQSLSGVTEVKVYENITASTDANGIPARSIAVVLSGGVTSEIGATIMRHKTPGIPTHGALTVNVPDGQGNTYAIRYANPTPVTIGVSITLRAFGGYSADVANEIRAALSAYISALPFGDDVMTSRLYLPAQLYGTGNSGTFEIMTLQTNKNGGSFSTSDIAIAYNEAATTATGNITITVV